MRTSADPEVARGAWTEVSGQWALQSNWDQLPQGSGNKFASSVYAENPFAWVGSSDGTTPAICTTGQATWEDYTFTAAIEPAVHGAVGVLANMTDARNGLLVRWSAGNDRGQAGNALRLYQLADGKQTLLAQSPGGYVPGQWYRLTLTSSLDGVRVSIDDQQRLSCDHAFPCRGGVGLYAEGTEGAVFDDVTVYGAALNLDLLRELRQARISRKFLDDGKMQEWSIDPEQWQPDARVPQLRWYPETLYGAHNWLCLTVTPAAHATGTLELILHGEHTAPLASGYRAVFTIGGSPPRQICTLLRGSSVLAGNTLPLPAPGVDYTIRLAHIGQEITLSVDDAQVLRASDSHPLCGGQAGYRQQGAAFVHTTEIHALSRNLLDYTFSEEPVDWFSVGTWMPSVRWSCTPTWSFLGGWSRGDAVLWHKARFSGDDLLEAFVGVKMEYPREREDYIFTRGPGYFAVTLCGDGIDPRNGYCGIYGAPGSDGTPYKRAVLLRNGVEVMSKPIVTHGWAENHHVWYDLRLEKQGTTVTFTVKREQERYAIAYSDPHPLAGGIPAIWTHNNALSLARARINFAATPTPRHVPQVVIDTPWYPEWADVGRRQTLHFPGSWSTTGQPVSLHVIPREVPPADNAAATAAGMDVTLTPAAAGDHWYQVVAGDGVNVSPPFQLDQTVFNPALGRDDSHTLVLYRFDEGSGGTVHDHGARGPALDLMLPANAQWVPGQGLTLHGPDPLLATGAAAKLLAPAHTQACTLEYWISAATIYTPYQLFAWGTSPTACNFALEDLQYYLLYSTHAQSVSGGDPTFPCLRSGLQHYVLTWDGTLTRVYRNGAFVSEKVIPWATAQWQASYPFTIGRAFLGTFYLLAIHDRCFSAEEIKRHYLAGPSAR